MAKAAAALLITALATRVAAQTQVSPEPSTPETHDLPRETAAKAEDTSGDAPTGEITPDETSASLRVGKRAAVRLEGGWSVLPLPSVGTSVGAFLKPDILVEAAYTRGLIHLYLFKAYSDVLELRLKKFWGNSFYTNLGVARRKIGAAFTLEPIVVTDVLDESIEATKVTLNGSIGNEWQWRHFTVSVDWFGVMWPVATLKSDDEGSTQVISEAIRTKKDEYFDRIAGRRTYSAFRVSFGVAF